MRKLIQFMHMTVDGYISTPDGGLGFANFDDPAIFDMATEICSASDIAMYGRGTYDIMDAYWPDAGNRPDASRHDIEHSQWYNGVRKIVLSETIQGDPSKKMEVIHGGLGDHGGLKDQFKALKSTAGSDLILMGSPTAGKALARLGLIDEYRIFLHPVILGIGKKMFDEQVSEHKLELIGQRNFTNGVLALHYRVVQ